MPVNILAKEGKESSPLQNSVSLASESRRVVLPKKDGGLRAWLQVLGAFCLSFATWGIVNSFGVYQTYYQNELLSSYTALQISWIGSIQAFLLLFVGVLTGPLFDQGYLNSMLLIGSFLTILGIMTTSVSTTYWQLMLAQGICVGIGIGTLFVPSIAVVSTYFTTRRAIATGLAFAGSSIGGIIYPITFRGCQSIGSGWATRIIGFISLALLCTAIATMWTQLPSKPPRSLYQLSAFKSGPYALASLGMAFGFAGLYIPMFYIQIYALSTESTSSDSYDFYLLAILNAGSFFGRVIPNFLASKIGSLTMLVLCAVAAGILSLCWIAIDDVVGLTFFAVIYGFFAGAYVSLTPPVLVGMTPDLSMAGTYLGMSMFLAACGLLLGNPIAGSLVNIEEKRFIGAQAFTGGLILTSAGLLAAALVIRARERKSWKV